MRLKAVEGSYAPTDKKHAVVVTDGAKRGGNLGNLSDRSFGSRATAFPSRNCMTI